MKRLGIIGGMSWESTANYYAEIQRQVRDRLGGLCSADIMLHSLEFAHIHELQVQGKWEQAGALLHASAHLLQEAGADVLLLATNTMHKVADAMLEGVDISFLHIADCTAAAILQAGLSQVALLGTRFTMQGDFYRKRIAGKSGVNVLVPEKTEQAEVDRIIFEELCLGKVKVTSKKYFLEVIAKLAEQGAQGVILGCTEIGILIKPEDTQIPQFDTTEIHVDAAVNAMLLS